MTISLFDKMDEMYPSMSKGQKRLTDFIKDNYEEAAFLTASKLGRRVDVSESTVVRYSMILGFEGYPQFQAALSDVVKGELTTMQKVRFAYENASQSEILNSVLNADIERINDTLSLVDSDAFESAVDLIMNANNIYIVGIRGDAPLASFLSFYLHTMFKNVVLVQTTSMNEIFEQLIRVDENDVVIGISFPRYSMRTLKALEFANGRNAQVIAITDSVHSPMNLYSSCNLFARSDSISIVDSLVAPLSVLNALIVALCLKKQDEIVDNLKMLENIWDDYQFYGPDDIDAVDYEGMKLK